MTPNYKRPFRQFLKKAHKALQLAIEDAVDAICEDPEIGELKVGDLAGIWVHKFAFNRQQYLIAYRPPTAAQRDEGIDIELLLVDFYEVGSHENFYTGLKQYLKTMREP